MSEPLSSAVGYKLAATPSVLPNEISLFRAITEHIPEAAVFVLDQDFRYLLAGGGGLHNAGMSPSDFEGKYLANVVPSELLSQYVDDYSAIFAGKAFVREHAVGSRFYRTRGRLIKGAAGTRDVALAVSYDITDEGANPATRPAQSNTISGPASSC